MSSDTNRETEVKLYTPDLEAIAARLRAVGARESHARVYERNIRYEDAAETLTPQGIVVRLRQDDRVRLTYKGPNVYVNGIGSRDEYEVEVSDLDTMHRILAHLGYHEFMVYEKYRTTYALDGCEIVLDEMPFGNFTEIEGTPGAIERVIERLNLAGAPRLAASYGRLFERVKVNMGIDLRDLTFANFADIDVTYEAIERLAADENEAD